MGPPTWTTPEYYVLPVPLTTPDSVDQYYADTLGIGFHIQCAVIPQNQFASECLPNRTSPIELRTTDCPLWGDMRYSIVTVKNDRCWEFPSRADGSPARSESGPTPNSPAMIQSPNQTAAREDSIRCEWSGCHLRTQKATGISISGRTEPKASFLTVPQ